MSFDVGSIVGKLELDINPYTQGMMQAGAIARLFPGVVQSFLANPLLGLMDILKEAKDAIAEFFSESAERADAMGDLATSIGVGVQQLTSMGFVAKLSGSSVEGLADSYRFLGRSVAEAMGDINSGASKTFRSLGVEFLSAEGAARPLNDVMLDLADAIQRMPAGAQRTQVAIDLLGRSGTELIPTLSQGKKAIQEQMDQMNRYGASVTESARDTGDRWRDSMDEIGFAWLGLKEAIAQPLRSALLPLLEQHLQYVRQHQPEIVDAIKSTLSHLEAIPKIVGPPLTWLENHFRDLVAFAGGVAAYIAGPAILGVILKVGPALFDLAVPLSAIRVGLAGIVGVLNPAGLATRLFSVALGSLVVTAIRSPQSLGAVGRAFEYVAATGRYVYDVIEHVVVPAVGNSLTKAFEHLYAILPHAGTLLNLFQTGVITVAKYVADVLAPAVGDTLASAFDWIGARLPTVAGYFLYAYDVMAALTSWIAGVGVNVIGSAFASAWSMLGQAVAAVRPYFGATMNAVQAGMVWIAGAGRSALGVFTSAWAAVSPTVLAVGNYLRTVLTSIIMPPLIWLGTTGVSMIRDRFAAAWEFASPVLRGVGMLFGGLFVLVEKLAGVLQVVMVPAFHIASDAVSSLGQMLGTFFRDELVPIVEWVWGIVRPLFSLIGEFVGGVLTGVGAVMAGVGEAVGWIAGHVSPILRGEATLIGGAFHLLADVFQGIVNVGRFVANAFLAWVAPSIETVRLGVIDLGKIISWAWHNITEPLIAWLWSAIKPLFTYISDTLHWFSEKLGSILSWLGKAIGGTNDLADAVNKIPSPAGDGSAATGSSGGSGGLLSNLPTFRPADAAEYAKSSGGAIAAAVKQAADQAAASAGVPSFDPTKYAAKGMAGLQGVASVLGDAGDAGKDATAAIIKQMQGEWANRPELQMPKFQMPTFTMPDMSGLGHIGQDQGVESLPDRFKDLNRHAAAAMNNYNAAKNGEHPDVRASRIAFNRERADWDAKIRQAMHGGGSPAEIEAMRHQKEAALRGLQGNGSGSTAVAGAAQTVTAHVTAPAVHINISPDQMTSLVENSVKATIQQTFRSLGGKARQMAHLDEVGGSL